MADAAQRFAWGLDQHRAGHFDAAERAYREALDLDFQHIDARYQLANLLLECGKRTEALAEMQRLVALYPRNALLCNELGTMQAKLGLFVEAVASFDQAVELDPALWHALYNRGNANRQLNRLEAAADSYRAAAGAAPNVPEIHLNLGVTQKELGQMSAARTSFETALTLKPDYADAWTNLGTVHKVNGDNAEALRCHRRAVELNPNSAVAQNNLGSALRVLNDAEPAIAAFRRALAIDTHYRPAQINLGNVLEATGYTQEAIECFEHALRQSPSDALVIKCGLMLPVVANSVQHAEASRQQLLANLDALALRKLHVEDPATLVGITSFPLAYYGKNEVSTQRSIASLLSAASPDLNFVATHCGEPRRPLGKKVRIGFISDNFRDHTIGKLNRGLIERLDRERFEVVVLRFTRPLDGTAGEITAAADTNVSLAAKLATARAQVAAERLDVLFYTDIGLEPLSYFLAFARLAPVQCVTWGHPLTTGLASIDYFISSEALEPADAPAHYSETLVRLPHLANFYYRPPPPSAKSRAEFGLPDDAHLYLSPQSLFKFHPDEDPVWGEILRRDPRANLVLLEGQFTHWTTLLRDRFARTMPDVAQRIVFLPRQGTGDFSRLLELADVMLDPLHFGGGDTSYQGFAVGTPIVTLPGEFLRSRITYALYRAMQVDDCIATSRADYIERALHLANDPVHRNTVSRKILAAGDTIFENDAGVCELADFLYEAAVRSRNAQP